jgi:hypothetical protein
MSSLRFMSPLRFAAFHGFVRDLPARALVLGLAVFLTGCASRSGPQLYANHMGAPRPAQGMAQERPAPVEMEGDGLPVKVAPLRSTRPIPDDPNEPFSPNYGSQPPRPLQPMQRASLGGPTRMAVVEQDAIIAQAIATHERAQQDSAPRRRR